MKSIDIDRKKKIPYLFHMKIHLWKRENGVYYAAWEDSGKTRRQSLKTRDKAQANRRLKRFKEDFIAGKIQPINRGIKQTLHPFSDEFLEYIETTKSHGTYELYETALEKAKDAWGDIVLSHITRRHLDKLISEMSRVGLKASTINKNMRHIKAALKIAQKWGYIAVKIDWPEKLQEEKVLRYLMPDQLRTVINHIIDPEFADCVLFAAYTGLRSGEIIRLQWSDIDNPEGRIRISTKQKNRNEDRIPINSHTRVILNRCKGRGGRKVFRFQTRQTLSKNFKKAVRAAGFEDIRFHDLRHTYGSHLALAGKGDAAIQQLMRHKSRTSTEVYTRLSPDHLQEASEAVNYGLMPLPRKGNLKNEQNN